MTRKQPTTRHRDQGMNLTEILVVIAIVSILMGLVLGGVAKMNQSAKETHARSLLTGLMGNAGTYETATGFAIDHLPSNKPGFDLIDWTKPNRQNAPNFTLSVVIDGDDIAGAENDFDDYTDATYSNALNDTDMEQANLYIERFIWAANQMPTIRKTLPSLGAGFGDIELDANRVPVGDGFLEVVDPWGNPIAYASKVSHKVDRLLINNGADDDFLPEHDAPFFASAGADQRWGRPKKFKDMPPGQWDAYKASDEYRFTLDNLYSFDLDRSAATRGD